MVYDHGWLITSHESGKAVQEEFDVAVVATGAFQKPTVTTLHDPDYTGIHFHSICYDGPSALDDRTVLIIGGGNSAKDIFWDALGHAKQVVLASPTEQDRNNVVILGNGRSKLQESFASVGRVKRIQKNGTVVHTNWHGQEEVLSGISVDMIIYCTGYTRVFPFLPAELQPNTKLSDGHEITHCFMQTAHKLYPHSLFFFHPSKARTTINSFARDTFAQARLIAALAACGAFEVNQLEGLDTTLLAWLEVLYTEWAKEFLTSCECFVQHTLFVNYLNCVVDHMDELSNLHDVGSAAMEFVRSRMKDTDYRRRNTLWHAGLELRQHAEAVNWNRFRSLKGRMTAGPNIEGSEFYEVTWFSKDGKVFSTFREDDIKYEGLIQDDALVKVSVRSSSGLDDA